MARARNPPAWCASSRILTRASPDGMWSSWRTSLIPASRSNPLPSKRCACLTSMSGTMRISPRTFAASAFRMNSWWGMALIMRAITATCPTSACLSARCMRKGFSAPYIKQSGAGSRGTAPFLSFSHALQCAARLLLLGFLRSFSGLRVFNNSCAGKLHVAEVQPRSNAAHKPSCRIPHGNWDDFVRNKVRHNVQVTLAEQHKRAEHDHHRRTAVACAAQCAGIDLIEACKHIKRRNPAQQERSVCNHLRLAVKEGHKLRCKDHHRDHNEGVPGCFFSTEAEATYDRSIEALCRDKGIL
mgnify:CR=1 FL=1